MRKIKSCPANLALLKHHKVIKNIEVDSKTRNNILFFINENENENENENVNKNSRVLLDIVAENLNEYIENDTSKYIVDNLTEHSETKLANYLIEIIIELIKNKLNTQKLQELLSSVFTRFIIYYIIHHGSDLISHEMNEFVKLIHF
jgi:hypothetical protein